MELFEAIKGRRSCRQFLPDAIGEEIIERILEAANWAPSPLNTQPWEFIVITNQEMKDRIYQEAERCRKWAMEASGWKWLGKYQAEFLRSVPVIIVVVGDPNGSGVDSFQEEGKVGYQHACAAAIQNMHLAAHALGLGSLWFTFFDKQPMRKILGLEEKKVPLAVLCFGRPTRMPMKTPRKEIKEKTTHII